MSTGSDENRSRLLVPFIVTVDAAALTAIAAGIARGWGGSGQTFALLAALAALAGARPVRFARFKTELTATHPFVLLAVAALGPLAAMVVAVVGLTGVLLRPGRKLKIDRTAFNLGAVVCASAAAAWSYLVTGGQIGGTFWPSLLPLVAATAAYFLVNTGLVTIAVALQQRMPMFEVWRESFEWTAVAYFTGLTLAAAMMAALQAWGTWVVALAIPPCWLLLGFYKAHQEALQEHERRVAEIEALNAELEQKVVLRTHELATALQGLEAANRMLQDANRALTDASNAKSEFLANVSHELRTPLNSVIGFSELMTDPNFGELNPRQLEFLSDIRDSGEHLLALINDILDLSKIEAGKLEVHREDVPIVELLRDSLSMLRPQAGKKRLQLEMRCENDVMARVDPRLVRQVLVNLLSNAVKFTPDDGNVEAAARFEGDDLVVTVTDSGIGIPEEDQEKIFHEFYQVDGSYSRKYQGTGLGLALVRRMMSLHSGAVTVTSRVGKGSCFQCVFPGAKTTGRPAQAMNAPAAHAAASAPEPQDARGLTVLVVEDNPVNRKLARNVLRARGYRVLEADTGEEGIELARRERPHLILMDLQLPGLDGMEATRRLKADPQTREIPVVALSAHAQDADEARAREAGCAGYIAKPIRLSRFPQQVRSYLAPWEGAA
ncbi:MAG TPA: ATP-binding protein [Candidatus Polarisedimenticolaceae bacterium]|nr:ATP-binding protein [Candidatus Polarisedimenticolaceae bacterium]